MKIKVIEVRLILPEEGVESVRERVLDHLYLATEGVEIKSSVRDATVEEAEMYVNR